MEKQIEIKTMANIDEQDTYALTVGIEIFLNNVVERFGINKVNDILQPKGFQIRTGEGEV